MLFPLGGSAVSARDMSYSVHGLGGLRNRTGLMWVPGDCGTALGLAWWIQWRMAASTVLRGYTEGVYLVGWGCRWADIIMVVSLQSRHSWN